MPQTIIDLGRKVKAKYPTYADMDDAELGRRMKAKYPEYSDFADVAVQPPAKSVFQRIGDALNQEQDTEREMATANAENVKQDWQQGTSTAKEGLGKLGNAYSAVTQPTAATPEERKAQRDRTVAALKEVPKGASQVFRGSMEAVKQPMLSVATPMIVAGGVPAVAGAAAGMAAQEGVERGIKWLGNKAIAPEPPTMPKQPGEVPGMGKTGGEQVEGLGEAAGDVAGLFTFGAEAATAKGTNALKKGISWIGKSKAGKPTVNGETVASLAEALKEKALNGKQNEPAYVTLLEELKTLDPEAARPFEAASPRAQQANQSEQIRTEANQSEVPISPDSPFTPQEQLYEQAMRAQRRGEAVAARKNPDNPFNAEASAEVFQDRPAYPEPGPKSAKESALSVMRDAEAVPDNPNAGGTPPAEVAPPPFKSAEESAAVFQEQQPPYPEVGPKSARESAKAFTPPEPRLSRNQRRASVAPPETGLPEEVVRGQAAREDAAMALGKRWEDLSNPERVAIDDLIAERNAGSATREPAEPAIEPQAIRPNLSDRPGRQISSGRMAGQRGSIGLDINANQNTPIPKEHLTPDDFVNFKRMVISPGEETALRGRIQQMIDDGTMTKDVEHHSAILAHAAEIGPEALRNVMAHGPGEGIGSRAAVQAMRDRQLGISREIVAARRTLEERRPSMSEQDAMGLESKIAQLENDEKQYLQWTAGQRTEAGRNLSALRIMANATLDMGAWTSKARSAMGLPPKVDLPQHVMDHVRALVVAAQQAAESGDARAAAIAKGQLAQGVAKLEETGWLETLTTLWKAGLLTAPPTHMVNLGGNVAFQTMELASRLPASLVDTVIGKMTKRRTVPAWTPKEIPAAVQSAIEGGRQALATLKTGMTPDQMAKGEITRELNFQGLNKLAENAPEYLKQVLHSSNDVINWYGRMPFRLLSAEDKLFKVYAAKNSLVQQAKLQAINDVKSGAIPRQEYAQRLNDLINKPTDDMVNNSLLYADYATFNNQNAFASGVTSGINTTVRKLGPVAGPAFKFATEMQLPFRNTPANLFERLLDYSPVGMIAKPAIALAEKRIAAKQFSKALSPDMQKVFSEAVGRGAIGTALIYAGYVMGKKLTATGPRPNENKGQSNVERRAGQLPGAVKVGDQWIQTMRLAPGGNLVAIGAAMAQAADAELKDEAKRPWNFARLAGQTMLEQPMLEGAKDTIEALDAPSGKRVSKLMADKAGSFVPAFVSRTIAPMVNPEVPQTQPPMDADALGTIKHGIQARLPGLRNKLPPLTDIFGNKVPSTRAQALTPLRTSEDRTQHDPLDAALMEVKAGINQVNPIAPESDQEFATRSLKDTSAVRRDRETEEEYNARKIATGGLIEEALRDALPQLPPEKAERRKAISSIVRQIHRDLTDMVKHDPSYLSLPPSQRAEYLLSLPRQKRP